MRFQKGIEKMLNWKGFSSIYALTCSSYGLIILRRFTNTIRTFFNFTSIIYTYLTLRIYYFSFPVKTVLSMVFEVEKYFCHNEKKISDGLTRNIHLCLMVLLFDNIFHWSQELCYKLNIVIFSANKFHVFVYFFNLIQNLILNSFSIVKLA